MAPILGIDLGTTNSLACAFQHGRPALVLRALKADAEAFLGAPVGEAVVTVPAYSSDAQRKATRAAGQLAGLRVEGLLNEPTAAALAYGLREGPAAEGKLLVLDLGSGTFDVSVLERFEGVMEIRATAGDNFLGGENFTQAIEDWFLPGAGRGLPGRGDPALAGLRRAAEMAKRRLGEAEVADVVLPWEGRELRATLTRDARLRPTDLRRVVLAGGATRMPAVRRLVARLFGQLPLQMLDPDEVVARGAARRGSAGRPEGAGPGAGRDGDDGRGALHARHRDLPGRRAGADQRALHADHRAQHGGAV